MTAATVVVLGRARLVLHSHSEQAAYSFLTVLVLEWRGESRW